MDITREAGTGIIMGARLFLGLELEGPRRGYKTLFVASPDVTLQEIVQHSPGAVYFGAGRLSEVNMSVVLAFQAVSSDKVTIESQDVGLLENALCKNDYFPLCIFTKSMTLPNGEVLSSDVPQETLDNLKKRYPHKFGVKTDDGEFVTIEFAYAKYVSNINSDYSNDVILS